MLILVLAPQPFFEPRGVPIAVFWRLRALSELGHEVDLLTFHVGQDVSIPEVVHHRTPNIRFIKTIKIGPSLTKLFLDVLLLIKAFRLLRKGRYDILVSTEEASFFGILLAKIFRVRHIYDMHSSLPDQLRDLPKYRFRLLVHLFEWLERKAIDSSDAIITVYPALEEYVKQIKSDVPQVLIENVASEWGSEAVSEVDVQTFKAANSWLHGQRIVLYTGNFLPYQGLDLLIASADEVLRQCEDVTFPVVGGNQDEVRYYQDRVRKLGLSAHFHFTGTRPPKEISLFVEVSYILVSPRISGTNTPLKIYSYLQSRKPIVATNLRSHTQVLNPDVAVLVEPDPDALAQGIVSVLDNPALASRLGVQARQFFESKYSVQTFIQKTAQVLEMAKED